MQIIRADSSIAGLRIDKFLCKNFDISFAIAQKLLRERKIEVNCQKVLPSYKILPQDQIKILSSLSHRKVSTAQNPKISLQKQQEFWQNVVFEDENLVAINKPCGLASQGGSGIDISVASYAKLRGFELVHRLDKDTSGLLLLAKNAKIADFLLEKFKKREVHKTYLALVCGLLKKDKITINIPLIKKLQGKNEKVVPDFADGKMAISELKTLGRNKKFSLVELSPLTGRTHQLRVHCKEIGHPIVGDVKYGGSATLIFKGEEGGKIQLAEDFVLNLQTIRQKNELIAKLRRRLCLHAQAILIPDYFGKKLHIRAPKPDFLAVC